MINNNNASHVSLKLLLPLLASIMALSPLAIDMYLPAMPVIVRAFKYRYADDSK